MKTEEYANEAKELVNMVAELKEPLKLLEMDNKYPLLKDLHIYTRAFLLVNPNYSAKRVKELQNELYLKVCKKFAADNLEKKSADGETKREKRNIKDHAYSDKYGFYGKP